MCVGRKYGRRPSGLKNKFGSPTRGGWNDTFTNSLSSFLREDKWQKWRNFIVKHCQIYISSSMNKCATQMALLATWVLPKLKVDVTIQNWFQQMEFPYMISTLEGGTKKRKQKEGRFRDWVRDKGGGAQEIRKFWGRHKWKLIKRKLGMRHWNRACMCTQFRCNWQHSSRVLLYSKWYSEFNG